MLVLDFVDVIKFGMVEYDMVFLGGIVEVGNYLKYLKYVLWEIV